MRARVLCALLLALVVAAPAAAGEGPPTLAELEAEIVCPTCQTTLDQSDAPIARRMKRFIAERIAAGDTETQIKDKLVAQFGPRVLAAPQKHGFDLLAWLLPPLGLLVAGVVVGLLAWRWSRARDRGGGPEPAPTSEPPLDPALERRLDDELARFDA